MGKVLLYKKHEGLSLDSQHPAKCGGTNASGGRQENTQGSLDSQSNQGVSCKLQAQTLKP